MHANYNGLDGLVLSRMLQAEATGCEDPLCTSGSLMHCEDNMFTFRAVYPDALSLLRCCCGLIPAPEAQRITSRLYTHALKTGLRIV